ncbi:MAG: TolC family protein [Gammaproteobacteria bacterium]|jgi:outer membrane protein TolC|nr:TolC family protein [Gammaproteobacteria bacterium]
MRQLLKTTALFSASLILLSTFTFADNLPIPPKPQKLTLQDAVLLSLRYNPQVQSAQIGRVVQKYGLVVAKNQYELQYALTGGANFNYSKSLGVPSHSSTYTLTPSTSLNLASGATVKANLTNTLNGPSSGGTYNPALTLSVTQPLLRGFGSQIALVPLANAYDSERINRLSLRNTIITNIVNVVTAYYQVIQAQQSLEAEKMTLDDVKNRLAQNNLMIKAGKMAPADNIQAQADLTQAELGYTSAQNTLLQEKLTLLNTIGLAPDANIIIDPELNAGDDSVPAIEDAKQKVLANDVGYQTLLINRRIDNRALIVAKDNQRIQLDLTASGTTGTNSGDGPSSGPGALLNGANQGGTVGLNLTVPIDDVRARQNTLQAKASLENDDLNIRSQAWSLETNTINTINSLKTLKAQLDIAEQGVEAQQRLLTLTELKRKYGLSSALDVSTQQLRLKTVQLNYIQTKINYLSTVLQFRQLLGETLEDWHVQVRY